MAEGIFATAINCMDGRVQLPVTEWLKSTYGVDYVDMITEAGPNMVLLNGNPEKTKEIQDKIRVSTDAHGSKVIAIVGHHDCAGNPIPKDQKVEQTKKNINQMNTWGLDAEIIGLYVNEKWEIERL